MKVTKKSRLEAARALIDSIPIGVEFTEEQLDAFMDITGYCDIDTAWRAINPKFPSDPRHIRIVYEGVEDGFSWNKAITQPPHEQVVKKALRDAIAPDLREFMSSVESPWCMSCGALDNLTVDHCKAHGGKRFNTIVTEFMSRYPDIELTRSPDGVGYMVSDMDIEAEWVQYHCDNAVYQILCRSCNASEGCK